MDRHAEIVDDKPDVPAVVTLELQQLIRKLTETSSLTDMVVATLAVARKVGLVLVQHVLEERDAKFRRSACAVVCPKPACGAPMKRTKNLRAVRRYTLLGALRYRRCIYACPRCDERCFPLDADLGVVAGLHGHSVEFASALVLLCVVVPFGKGCELFSRLAGFAISTRLARALTFDVGTRLFAAEMNNADQLWAQRSETPEMFEPPPATLRGIERHKRVYVMTDNSKVGLQNGEKACEIALSHGAFRLRTSRQLLTRHADRQLPLDFLEEHPIIRPLDDYAHVVQAALQRQAESKERFVRHDWTKATPADAAQLNFRADAQMSYPVRSQRGVRQARAM